MGSACSSLNNEPSAPQGRGPTVSSPPPPQQQQQPSACSANSRGENKVEVVEKEEPQLTTDQQRHVKSVESNPSDAAAWHAIGSDLPSGGTVLIGGTMLVTEQQCFQKVLELEPDNSNAWRKIGTTVAAGAEVMVGGVGYTGQQCYIKAIVLQPKDSYAWYNLGASLPDGGDEEGGGGEGIAAVVEVGGKEYTRIQCYVQAVQVNPQNGIAWRNLGTTLSEENPTVEVSGETLSEQQCYVKSIECDATDTGSWYNLGTTLEANSVVISGDTITERICFIKVLELSPSSNNNLNAWGMLGIALTSAGEEDVTVGGILYTRKQCLTQGGPPYDQIA